MATELPVSYTPGHPVLLIYGSKVDDKGSVSEGRAERVCSLGELNEQLSAEKAKWRFYIGTLMTSLLSIAFIILRFTMKGEQAKEAANKTARGAIPSESQGSDGLRNKKRNVRTAENAESASEPENQT